MPLDDTYVPAPPTPRPRFACAKCGSATADVIANWVADAGDLWRIPVRVCTNARCLRSQGATMQKAITRGRRR